MRAAAFAVLLAACAHEPAKPPPPVEQPAPVVQPKREAEPADEIKVEGTLGSLNDEEISGPFQRRWDEITQCYQQAQAKLWYLGGKIDVHVRIDKSGAPKQAFVSSSTFGNYDVERCVLDIARTLTFSRPHGGSEAEFTYPIEFRARAAIAEWDQARVQPAVARHKRDVAACKQKSPGGLPPTLTLTMYVAPGGKVTSAGLAADAPLDDAFAQCLVQKTRAWKLDDPLGKIAKATVGVGD